MKFTIILLLFTLFFTSSKKLFTFHNIYNNISHISVLGNKYRESTIFYNQKGYIYFRQNINANIVLFNDGYIDYINMNDYLHIKSDKNLR